MRSTPSYDFQPGRSYRFQLKRHGTSRLAEYDATFDHQEEDRLVFMLVGHSQVRVKVYADKIDNSSVRELDV